MTPPRPASPFHLPSPQRATVPHRPPAPPGLDGVAGDVLVTVLLAALVAALVATVLFLIWRALPSPPGMTAVAFAIVVPPPPRRRGPADAPDEGAVRGVVRRVAAAVAIPVVAIGVTSLYWSREVVAAPGAILLGLLLVVVEVRILGTESWRRARRAWRRR